MPARRAPVRSLALLAAVVGSAVWVNVRLEREVPRRIDATLPPRVDLTALDLMTDQTLVRVRLTVAWQKVHTVVTAERVKTDHTLWRNMNFDDWDTLPAPLRHEGIDAMWAKYVFVVHNPGRWDRMTAHDWDWIPQPMRAMAFIEMIRYWSGFYHVGASYGLRRGTVTNTMAAIVMTESWFEHRATNSVVGDNRDLGLAQASDATREAIRGLHDRGVFDFAPPTDDDYFDPWQATRVVAAWFELMLKETHGDLDAAVRAYHRGGPLARRGQGDAYLAGVVAKRRRFMTGQPSGSPAWDDLAARTSAVVAIMLGA